MKDFLINFRTSQKTTTTLLIILALISFLRSFRFTGNWAATHYCFNYDAGFIKRGFLGTIFGNIFGSWYLDYNVIFYITLMIMLFSIGLIIYIFRNVILEDRTFFFVAVVFLTSPNIIFYIHIIGYYDQLGVLAILFMYVLLQKVDYRVFFILMILLFMIMIFVHEVLVILFGVPAFLLLLLSLVKHYGISVLTIRNMFLTFLAIIIPALLSLTFILNKGTIDKHNEIELYNQLNNKTNFVLRKQAFQVLSRNSAESINIMKDARQNNSYHTAMIFSFLVYFPSLIILMYYGIRKIFSIRIKNRFILIFYFIIGSLSPIMIHYVAWDLHRWNSNCLITSLLSLIIIWKIIFPYENEKKDEVWFSLTFLLIIVVINLISNNYMLDFHEAKMYPFAEHIYYIIDLFSGKTQFPIIP